MPSSPPIFDRTLLRRRLARATKAGGTDFLLDRAVDDIRDRLSLIRRRFETIADIGTPGPALARALESDGGLTVRVALVPNRLPSSSPMIVGDEETLPLRAEAFDLAVSALSLHHVNDLPGALLQIRRILKPDGLFLGCLFGGRSLTELRAALAAAEAEIDNGVSPRVIPFADVRDMGGLLQRAGFALPVADSESLSVRYANMFALLADLRAMGATNVLAARRRRFSPRRLMLRAADIYAERFADPDGRVRATFEMIFISGWAPHPSQQQPLKPGSAKVSLVDALGQMRRPNDAG